MSALSFNLDLGRFANKVAPEQVSIASRKLALDALRGVVEETPVDTGRARGGWQANPGFPINSEIDREDKSGRQTVEEGGRAIGRAQYGEDIYLTNNVEYIKALENGSSRQAPNGMIAVTVARLGGVQ